MRSFPPKLDEAGRNVLVAICPVSADADELCWRSLPQLSDMERERAHGFRFYRDRHSYVLAHLLLRRCLAAATGRRNLAFVAGPYGKPELVPHGEGPPIGFNISHTEGLAACALSAYHEVGIDIEASGRLIGDAILLARHHFTPRETEALVALPTAEQATSFLATWTMKEAVVKATGLGLELALDSFTTDAGRDGVTFAEGPAHGEPAWFLRQLFLPRHHLAVAVRPNPKAAKPQRLDMEECEWRDLLAADDAGVSSSRGSRRPAASAICGGRAGPSLRPARAEEASTRWDESPRSAPGDPVHCRRRRPTMPSGKK